MKNNLKESKDVKYTKNLDEDSEFIKNHEVLVKKIAHHLKSRLPSNIQVEDLIQAGMIGLLEAHKKYDQSKGASFETYAGIRIRGAMLDEIRKSDWTPRSVHRNSRLISQTIREVENKLGRDAKDHEVADRMGVSLDKYYQMLQDTNDSKVIGIEDIGIKEQFFNIPSTDHFNEIFTKVELLALKKTLDAEISYLSEKERLVLLLYYREELNLKEVGNILGVSESRVSQIHAQAMVKLKSKFKNFK